MGGVQGTVAALDLIGAVMARDYKAMEAEFIADLKARSGRDLAEWMAAIVRRIKAETPLAVTLSLGERDEDELAAWRKAHKGEARAKMEERFDATRPEIGQKCNQPR